MHKYPLASRISDLSNVEYTHIPHIFFGSLAQSNLFLQSKVIATIFPLQLPFVIMKHVIFQALIIHTYAYKITFLTMNYKISTYKSISLAYPDLIYFEKS
jgi:hypothetical protein